MWKISKKNIKFRKKIIRLRKRIKCKSVIYIILFLSKELRDRI